MPEHCRECSTLGRGECDCARLLAEREKYDTVAKPLLAAALGKGWLGMDDITTPWIPERARRDVRELAHVNDEEQRLIRELDECRARKTTLTERIKALTGESEASGGD